VLEALPEAHRRTLRVYTAGVNAGLRDLGAAPPEYLLLALTPEPWTELDSIMVVLGMWRGLALVGNAEPQRAVLEEALPAEVVRFLLPEVTRFDAPAEAGDGAPSPAPIPRPEVFDPRAFTAKTGAVGEAPAETVRGSNAWVVSGTRTGHGGAILANDMHLGLMVPAQWYWAELAWREGAEARRAMGVTLAGVPALVAGSNGFVAWGFTNVTGDVADWVIVEEVPGDPSRYRTEDGDEAFTTRTETVRVRFGADREIAVRETRWGRVTREDHRGRPMVLKWTGSEAQCIDLRLLDMLDARTVESALDVAASWGGPPQNVMVAGDDGRVGWTIAGRFPVRAGFDGRRPVSWGSEGAGWTGFVPAAEKVRITAPREGFLVTANARTVAADRALVYGHHFAPAYRQARIAEVIASATEPIDERATIGLQNDTRVESMEFWRDLVLEVAGDDPAHAAAADLARAWNGRADVDSQGLALIEAFRAELSLAIFGPIEREVQARTGASASPRAWFHHEEVLRRLVEERPAHWVPARRESWDALLRYALRGVTPTDASTRPRTVPVVGAIRHPVSWALGGRLKRFDMPGDRIAGHPRAVRVMGPTFGASQRMAISPGREDAALVELPCGPSGHPMSRWYRSTHQGWVMGDPIPAGVGGVPGTAGFTVRPVGDGAGRGP
jgi:penicillin amidase